MKKFFAFLWKWPLPIFGLISLLLYPLAYAIEFVLISQARSLFGDPPEGQEKEQIFVEATSPDGLIVAKAIEYYRDASDLIHALNNEYAPLQQGVLLLISPDDEPDPEEVYYAFSYNHINRYDDDLRGEISLNWVNSNVLQVMYCNLEIAEFSNVISVELSSGDDKQVEVILGRDPNCISKLLDEEGDVGGNISLTTQSDIAQIRNLADPVEAGWNGAKVCETLHENDQMRALRCTFPPGGGHEKHFHAPHFGYILKGGLMKITDVDGTEEVQTRSDRTWWSDGTVWHEVEVLGEETSEYLIIEPKE